MDIGVRVKARGKIVVVWETRFENVHWILVSIRLFSNYQKVKLD